MGNDTTVPFFNLAVRDEMTELIRAHARTAIRQAELAAFLAEHDDTNGQGRQNLVRNGYQPERQVLSAFGQMTVQLPKTRDRSYQDRCFLSLILLPYPKKDAPPRGRAAVAVPERRLNQRLRRSPNRAVWYVGLPGRLQGLL